MRNERTQRLLQLAFLTALASSIHIVESLVLRMLPIPFIRVGLSNIVVLYLVMQDRPLSSVLVNVVKSLLGGVFTFTLLTPGTMISLAGGISAIIAMYVLNKTKLGFTCYGVSIIGAVAHNMAQLLVVRILVVTNARVFILTPILIILGIVSGFATAYLLALVSEKIEKTRQIHNEEYRP